MEAVAGLPGFCASDRKRCHFSGFYDNEGSFYSIYLETFNDTLIDSP